MSFNFGSKQDLHLTRKVFHAMWGVVYGMGYLYYFSKLEVLALISIPLVFFTVLEILRIFFNPFFMQISRRWRFLLRESDLNGFNTGFFYNLSSFLVVLLFPKVIAGLSIMYLAFGDPVAALIGVLYGKRGIQLTRNKSLVGTLAGTFVCSLATLLVFASYPISLSKKVLIVFVGGVIGGFSEMLPLKLDDNLTVPLVSSVALLINFKLINI